MLLKNCTCELNLRYCIFTLLFLEFTNILITFALTNQTSKHHDSNTTQGGIDA